jgi:hypothetical protein
MAGLIESVIRKGVSLGVLALAGCHRARMPEPAA